MTSLLSSSLSSMIADARNHRVFITYSGRDNIVGEYFKTEEECRNFLKSINIEPEEFSNYQAGYLFNGFPVACVSDNFVCFCYEQRKVNKKDLPSWLLKMFPNMFRMATDDFYDYDDGHRHMEEICCYGLAVNNEDFNEFEPLEYYGEGMYGATTIEYLEGRMWKQL